MPNTYANCNLHSFIEYYKYYDFTYTQTHTQTHIICKQKQKSTSCWWHLRRTRALLAAFFSPSPPVSVVNQQNKTATKWEPQQLKHRQPTRTDASARRNCNSNCNFQLRPVFWTFADLPPPPTARTLPVARCCFCFLFAHTSLLIFFLPHTKLCFNTIHTHRHTHTLAHTQAKRNRGPNKCKSTLALSFNDWKRNEQKHWLKRPERNWQQLIVRSAAK